MKEVDYIIVGLGIAGASLIAEILDREKTFICIDHFDAASASHVSSGLINPITGRKFVKSWLIDDLLPMALKTYQFYEQLLDQKLLNNKLIIRSLNSPSDENQFFSRTTDSTYREYITEDYYGPQYGEYLNDTFSFAIINKSLNINTSSLLKHLRVYLSENNFIHNEKFRHNELNINDTYVEYKDFKSKHVIFAEGANCIYNPYFNDLPFRPVKGEVLICKIDEFPQSHILKYHKFLVPYGDNSFWVGSTYEWDYDNLLPSSKGLNEIKQFLDRYLKLPYKIVDHKAAVRPATKYRKPFVGTHPQHKALHILNGLGTKGISLAPYWANYLMDRIDLKIDKSIHLPPTSLL